MKKELSKKISLMLCSALFLPSVVGFCSVHANPNKPTCPGAPKKSVSTIKLEIEKRFQNLNDRFAGLFGEMCQRHGISVEIYRGVFDIPGILSTMRSREDLFLHPDFAQFFRYAEDFLAHASASGDSELQELIFQGDTWVDNFAARHNLNVNN